MTEESNSIRNAATGFQTVSQSEAMGGAASHASSVSRSSSVSRWCIADCGVLGLWIAVAGFTLRHHEKWADEAQAWLLVRDLDLKALWLHELRYEGSPGLWHTILWVAQHVFHAPYASIGVIGLAGSVAGVAFMFWKAPFPRPLRYLLAFSYFMVYQYAVIARPYTLLPLLTFAAAYLFRDLEHPERMTLVLALLALLTVHGILIAAALGLAYLLEAAKAWHSQSEPLRRRYVACVTVMLMLFLFLFVILKPTPDVEVIAVKQNPSKYHVVDSPKLTKLISILSGALMDYWVPSAFFLLLAGAWCHMRRKLLAFALPTALLIVLYTGIYGAAHHHGAVFIAVIAGLWIAWPTQQEQQAFTIGERRATQGMVALLVCLFGINIWDAAISIRNEYRYPYSGAQDAANYLKSVGADGKSIFGYMYGVAGVQAYFNHNILSNMPTSYYHHGLPLYGRVLDVDELRDAKPEYLLIHSLYPDIDYGTLSNSLDPSAYKLVHFSDGYLFFKQIVYERQAYFIYQRVH
ncbi:MAG: hypothetical protein ABSD96_11885 [Candidatus Korobacteraceae bacterium]|jgi:hypothetical protein